MLHVIHKFGYVYDVGTGTWKMSSYFLSLYAFVFHKPSELGVVVNSLYLDHEQTSLMGLALLDLNLILLFFL